MVDGEAKSILECLTKKPSVLCDYQITAVKVGIKAIEETNKPSEDIIKNAFEMVGIAIRTKWYDLAKEEQTEKANELKTAYDIINRYFNGCFDKKE